MSRLIGMVVLALTWLIGKLFYDRGLAEKQLARATLLLAQDQIVKDTVKLQKLMNKGIKRRKHVQQLIADYQRRYPDAFIEPAESSTTDR